MIRLFIMVAYVAMSLYGLYKLKATTAGSIEWMIGFGAYGGGFVLWLYILRIYPLSVAFPLAAGSLILGTQIVGYLLLQEHGGWMRATGAALVFVGIVMLGISDLNNHG